MKNLVYLFMVFFFALGINAQCKVEEDASTKEKVAKYDWEGIIHDGNPPFSVSYTMKNTDVTLTLTWSYKAKMQIPIPQGSEVLIKLENGEILKYVTNSVSLPQAYTWKYRVWTKYTYECLIPKYDLDKIIASKVNLVRLKNTSKDGTVDLAQYNKGLRKGAQCLAGK